MRTTDGSGAIPDVAEPEAVPFFHDLEPAERIRDARLDHYVGPDAGADRRPVVIFVHGGPIPEGHVPRDWEGFVGYGTLAAAHGLVGVTFDHRLFSDMHYPQSAEDLAEVVERTRELDVVDPDRVALWLYSGGGPLAVDWMVRQPTWLRAIAWTYPVLAPPPDWPGDGPRFDAVTAVGGCAALPKLLVRVGDEFVPLAQGQDAFVTAAQEAGAALDVIEIPSAAHGFEGHGENAAARASVEEAMAWMAATLRR